LINLKKENPIKTLTQSKLILYTALFLVLFDNYSFFSNVLKVYPLNITNIGPLLSLGFVLFAVIVLLFTLLSSKFTTKPILIIVVIVSSLTNYFMNTYHIVVDESMIRNTMQTNINESMDLLSIKQVVYFLFLGLLPAWYIYKAEIYYRGFKSELIAKVKLIALALAIVGVSAFAFGGFYASFLREHKPLRFTTNPTYWIYSLGKYISLTYNSGPIVLKAIGEDATIESSDKMKKIVIMVVGEAARADHFSLNGYERETNPLLKKEDIINFSNTFSCGTSTAESVPCMFSVYDRSDYSYKKGISTENVVDVLKHTNKIALLWRDNNSDSKGVALRIPYQNYKSAKNNTICENGECRDVGMLVGLDDFIEKNRDKDIFIVLHQMGNHGPEYYKRYPKAFEKFTPTCKTNQLEQCSEAEVNNAYDNALLYTDYFLTQTIDFLKKYNSNYKTAMIYMSDHGESLGEGGLYLHGLPYFIAPDAQKHIGTIMWFDEKMKQDFDVKKLKANSDKEFSQDNLFSTLLGLFKVKTEVYEAQKDMLR